MVDMILNKGTKNTTQNNTAKWVIRNNNNNNNNMDQRTRKPMTRHKALHPRDDVDRLNVSRKEGGRELTGIKDSINKMNRKLHKKARKKTDYGHHKNYR